MHKFIINSSTVLYAEAVSGNCSSQRVAIAFDILPTVPQPSATTTQYICGSGTVADLVASGVSNGVIEWFSSAGSTVPLDSNSVLVNGTYYVSQRI